MPVAACKIVAVNGRDDARPCEGWWGCNDADGDAWVDSSRVIAAYALELGKWIAASGSVAAKAAAIDVIRLRVDLLADVAALEGQWIEFSQAANQRAIAKIISAQQALCNAISKASALMDGVPGAPPTPELWAKYEEKRKGFFDHVTPGSLVGTGVAIAVLVVGGYIWLQSLGKAGSRSRRR